MVKLRLTRFGHRNHACFRLVVTDSRAARDGRFIELLGWYQPLNPKQQHEINGEKALEWLKKGAVPSDTAKSLLRKIGVLKQFHDHRCAIAMQRKQRKTASAAS